MDEHQPTTAPRHARGTARRFGGAAAWLAAGAIGATALTGVAQAAGGTDDSGTDPSTGTSSDAPAAPMGRGGPGHGGGHGGGPGGGPLGERGAVLHGELVIEGEDDATTTVLTQSGSVTAASSTSITVRSTDGFTATWSVDEDTSVHTFASRGTDGSIGDVEVGDEVRVSGPKESSTSGEADRVHVRPTEAELSELRGSMPERGAGPGAPPTGDATTVGTSAA